MRSLAGRTLAGGLALAGLAAVPLAAMPPRSGAGQAGAPSLAELREEIALRKELRRNAERKLAQALAHAASAMRVEGMGPESRGWVWETTVNWTVDSEFCLLKIRESLQAYRRAGACRTLQVNAIEKMQKLEAMMDQAAARELLRHSARLRALERERAGLEGRGEAGAAGLRANRDAFMELTGSYEHMLREAKAAGWRGWRSHLADPPPGHPAPPPPSVLPPGLVLPPERPRRPWATPAVQWVQTRLDLGLPIGTELPGAQVPMRPQPEPVPKVLAERRKIQAEAQARVDPQGPPRPMERAAEALGGKLERMEAVSRQAQARGEARAQRQDEQAERQAAEAERQRAAEEREEALSVQRHADRLRKRQAARELRERERLAWEAALATEPEREAAARERQAERDAQALREAEAEAAAERLDRHHRAQLARRAAAERKIEAPAADVPAPPAASDAPAGPPPIATIRWSRRAEEERDQLDWRTDEGVEAALEMLASDGIDRSGKRTKLIRNTDGRVVELRVHGGRSACRLLYVQLGPGEIEIVRVTRTSQEAGAAFQTAVDQACQAAAAVRRGDR